MMKSNALETGSKLIVRWFTDTIQNALTEYFFDPRCCPNCSIPFAFKNARLECVDCREGRGVELQE